MKHMVWKLRFALAIAALAHPGDGLARRPNIPDQIRHALPRWRAGLYQGFDNQNC